MTHWFERRESIADDQYPEVKYEDVIGDQEAYLRKICNFIRVEYDSRMEDVMLRSESVGRYRSDLSPDVLSPVEDTVAPILDEYYATDR
jgi:hypothetical protein